MNHMTMLISAAVLSAATLTACGGTTQPSAPPAAPLTAAPSSPSAPQAPGSEIVISNMTFEVPPSVSPGQQLTIVNNDSANHTVTADENNLFDIRVSGGGGSESFTAPTTPGTYPFHCKYHANMHGVLTVG